MSLLQRLVTDHGAAFALHVVVSTAILMIAFVSSYAIPRLTERTRHAILIAGMAAMLIPPALAARLVDLLQSEPVRRVALAMPTLGGKPIATVVREPVRFAWSEVAAIAWLAVAAFLFLRWWITSRRLVTTALRVATSPPPRVVVALESARRRLGIRHSIDLVSSPLCEAPAVVRVVRPLIVLPVDGCSVLDDDELESLLAHECAHVARRDNLVGVFEAVICSLFWFNPLVWLVHRRIGGAREAACDEMVAESALSPETYVGALAKFCESLIAPKLAGVSCMANAHLKERIRHLMAYDSIRKSAFSHRLIISVAAMFIISSTLVAGIVTATPPKSDANRFQLNYSVTVGEDGLFTIRTKIVDNKSGEVFGEPAVTTRVGVPASAELTREAWRLKLNVTPDSSSGRIELLAYENETLVQHTTETLIPETAKRSQKYHGKPITLNLKDAEIHDVLKMFSQLTGLAITTAPEVKGTVTMRFTDVPWDEALDRILTEKGWTWVLRDSELHIYKAEK